MITPLNPVNLNPAIQIGVRVNHFLIKKFENNTLYDLSIRSFFLLIAAMVL